jgi:hypothetical protein
MQIPKLIESNKLTLDAREIAATVNKPNSGP